MRTGGRTVRGRLLLAGLVFMGLSCPTVASADPIRILFLVSRDFGVDVQVTKLERAIQESHGPLAVAGSLSEAHVVVQFTAYRRSIGAKGEPLQRWIGHAKLLAQPPETTVGATPFPERFQLLVIGKEGSEAQRARELLERMLSKSLHPKVPKPPKEAI